MNRHALEVLEFNRVVELVRGKCLSEIGAALADRMTPYPSIETVREEHAKLVEVCDLLDRRGVVPVGGAEDIRPALARSAADGSILEAPELLAVLRVARVADDCKRFLRGESEACPRIAALAGGLEPLVPLQKEIARCIDDDGNVVDAASAELAAIRAEIEATREEVRRILERYLHSTRAQRSLQESIITLRNGRYVLPVKEEERRTIDGIVHDHSGSGATVFIEPIETVEKNNRLARLHREEKREVRRILRLLTDAVREAAASLARNGDLLAALDFVQAKAVFGREGRAVVPLMGREERIRILRGRHPLLERSLGASGRAEGLIPLDLEFPVEARTMVLTGPNAGGKTVALKTLGLFALMAQAGLALPAAEGTSLPFFEKVFADIGDEQSIENSLSSFSAKLRQMVRIVSEVGPGSLVLLDEVGTGTDPEEGAALAMSLLEEIHGRGAVSLVTTHLGSIKVFVHDNDGMTNASMAFDREKLWPTYRLEVGLPGTSHALEIAERLGLPEKVVERARLYIGGDQAEIETLLDDLKGRQARARELETELASEKAKTETTSRRLADEERALAEKTKEWERRRVEEASRLVDEARALVERTIRELRSRGADAESVRLAHAALEEERARLAARRSELEAAPGAPPGVEIGQMVHVRSMNRDGRVVGKGNRPGRVFVEAGGVRLEIALADLGAARGRPQARRAAPVEAPIDRDARHELDLRGLRVEEAREALDKFLDRAAVAGIPSVRIIHGIGTGAVRSEVAALLAVDPRVEGFRLGENGGFTVAEIG
ncbi:MAG: endonuclease MutS2 [Candidatus Latescibacterota bacterium]|nr:MAG: endonuclease MutS2 [Candidatus Latescibacterota bacterium]